MALLNPYINFSGVAREAMTFYQDVFGGTLTFNTFGEYGQAGTPIENQIMHSTLQASDGFILMGADTPPGMDAPSGSAITISLSGDDEAELRGYWDKLIEGGTVSVPLEPQMWGDTFGMGADRFGIGWMVNITPSDAA